jgi:hypothetical protein
MDTPELFPGEHGVHEMAAQADWSPSIGNGFAAVFESSDDDSVTLRAYASFFEAGVRPAFLISLARFCGKVLPQKRSLESAKFAQ